MQAGGQEFDPPQLHQILFTRLPEVGCPDNPDIELWAGLESQVDSDQVHSPQGERRSRPMSEMFDNEIDWVNILQG